MGDGRFDIHALLRELRASNNLHALGLTNYINEHEAQDKLLDELEDALAASRVIEKSFARRIAELESWKKEQFLKFCALGVQGDELAEALDDILSAFHEDRPIRIAEHRIDKARAALAKHREGGA